MSVRLYVSLCPPARPPAWNNSAPTGRIFMKFGIWRDLEDVEKIKVWLKYDKINWYFAWRPTYYINVWQYLAQFFLEWEICIENRNIFYIPYFFYEYMWIAGKQWQTTPKNLPRMQCARAMPVTWLGSGSCQARPSRPSRPGLAGIIMNEYVDNDNVGKKC